jgi:hypothetical protein
MVIFSRHKSSFTIGSTFLNRNALCLVFVIMHRSVDLGSHLGVCESGYSGHSWLGRAFEIDDRGGAVAGRPTEKELEAKTGGHSDETMLEEVKRSIIFNCTINRYINGSKVRMLRAGIEHPLDSRSCCSRDEEGQWRNSEAWRNVIRLALAMPSDR